MEAHLEVVEEGIGDGGQRAGAHEDVRLHVEVLEANLHVACVDAHPAGKLIG